MSASFAHPRHVEGNGLFAAGNLADLFVETSAVNVHFADDSNRLEAALPGHVTN